MFGMEKVETVTNLFTFKKDVWGSLILTGVQAGLTSINFDEDGFELQGESYFDYIGENAFANAPNLSNVYIGYRLGGIYNNAFAGVTSDSLTLDFSGTWYPPQLMDYTPEHPFTFGADEDKIHILISPFSEESEYIDAWMFPFAGYGDLDEIREGVKAETDSTVTDVEVDAEIADRLFKVENRLRKMLGMEKITDVKEIACIDLTCYSKEEALKNKADQQRKDDSVTDENESAEKDDESASEAVVFDAEHQEEEMKKTEETVPEENAVETESMAQTTPLENEEETTE